MDLNSGSGPNNIPRIKYSTWIWASILSYCVALFFLVWITDLIPSIRSPFFDSTQCVVKETLVSTFVARRGAGASKKPNVFLSFQVNGKEYNAWAYNLNQELNRDSRLFQDWRDKLRQGEALTCWYDPLYPNLVVLIKPSLTQSMMFLCLPLVLIFFVLAAVFGVRRLITDKQSKLD